MSADFILLDRNLFVIPIEEIHDTQVQGTWFAGRLVHDGSSAS
jgi:predicted amidohydrolase YtcJ